jgi:hypothetical protein
MAGVTHWLERFDVGHRYEITLPLAPATALQRALETAAAPDRLVRLLFKLRGLRPGGAIPEFFAANGFTLLERTATSFVIGLLWGYPRGSGDVVAAWRGAPPRGSLRIAGDFRAEPVPEGARLITETRVAAADRSGLLRFRLYWLLVGPWSRLIRRRWLREVGRRTASP